MITADRVRAAGFGRAASWHLPDVATAQIVFPHQLFVEHLEADVDTVMVLVEPDLFFRQLPFHAHKLVLHRSTMRTFEDRLRAAGFATVYVATSAEASTDEQLQAVLRTNAITEVTVYDVVDDWLDRDLRRDLPRRRCRADRRRDAGLPHDCRGDRRDLRRP